MEAPIKPWKTLASNLILDHEQLQVVEDSVRLPNGRTSTYVKHAPAKHQSVIMIALNNRQEILLQREYSYPPNKVMWQFPGGSMQTNETIEAAANRELAEESGYHAGALSVIGSYYTHNRLSDQRQYVVLCTDLQRRELTPDADEFITSHWMPVAQFRQMIAAGTCDNINLLAAFTLWSHRHAKDG
jgi:ADP-ribose pyrophosphatase